MHTELSLLIRAGDFWRVSKEVGKRAGWLRAKVVTEEDKQMPPVKGWTYWDGGKMESDPTLECSREVTPACSEIIVELQGKAEEKLSQWGGSYLPVKGKINRGRWVGSYQQHSFAFNNCHQCKYHYTIVFDKY